ncbi:phosphotransferase system, enzyme I, PtsI [Ruaniaceae bacterium KH17]|nr:phosphotransferase system, enzyme I, PtsI [Ruaniaceae bacterium KH17]
MARTIRGIGVSGGFAVAPVVRVAAPVPPPDNEPAAPDAEAQVQAAFDAVASELQTLAQQADGDARDVLSATALMAGDPALLTATQDELAKGKGPATAINDAIAAIAGLFEGMGEYYADRATDIRGIGARAVAAVLGRPAPGVPVLTRPSVVVARDLTPAETVGMDLVNVAGIVTMAGGRTGHTAILAAQYGIPAVVQAGEIAEVRTGTVVAVDGTRGEITVEPSEEFIAEQVRRRAERQELIDTVGGPGATRCGHRVALLLNIGDAADARLAKDTDCEGVGLFRTEFLYLTATTAPSVEKQAAAYRAVFEAFPRVTIRTLDAGADKPLAFADLGPEDNPALGRRGLRLSTARPELLRTQLAAIAQAAEGTDCSVRVMAPMVATADEAEWFARAVRTAGLETAGVMIEVPAAALGARAILDEVDFGSLGTNDLAQYVMAADRTQGVLSDLLDPWQPAVLACVEQACEGARAAGKPLGVCGESAGDPALALVLVGLGVSSLSMAPGLLPAVRASLALHTLEHCQKMAAAAVSARSAQAAREAVFALAAPELGLLAS